jgi:hypothetical protein
MKRSEIQERISDLEVKVRDFSIWRTTTPATYTINRMQDEINTLYKILVDAGLIEAIPKVSGDYRVQNIHFKLKEKE